MNNQADCERVLQAMAVGEMIVIPGRGGWAMKVMRANTDLEFDFTHVNYASDSGEKFYVYDTVDNPHGAGKVFNERTLGVPCRNCGVVIDGNIVGATVLDTANKVTGRFSWSNVIYGKGGSFSISPDGELVVNGQSQGYLHGVFLADKNRIDGYVGVFRPTKPVSAVLVAEMEQLVLAWMTAA